MRIKTDEIKKIIDEEFIKVAREVRRLTEREAVAVLRTLAEQPIDTETAVNQIETVLKDLSDQGLDNEGLKKILTQIIHDIDKGFVGEPLHEAGSRSHALGRYRGERDIMGRPDSNRARRDREKGITRGQFSDYQLAKAEELGMHPSNIPDEGESAELHKGFRPGTPKTDHDKRRDQAAAGSMDMEKARDDRERHYASTSDAFRKGLGFGQPFSQSPKDLSPEEHADFLAGYKKRMEDFKAEGSYDPRYMESPEDLDKWLRRVTNILQRDYPEKAAELN